MKKNYLTPQVKIAHIGIQSILCNSAGPDPTEEYMQVYSEKTTSSVW